MLVVRSLGVEYDKTSTLQSRPVSITGLELIWPSSYQHLVIELWDGSDDSFWVYGVDPANQNVVVFWSEIPVELQPSVSATIFSYQGAVTQSNESAGGSYELTLVSPSSGASLNVVVVPGPGTGDPPGPKFAPASPIATEIRDLDAAAA